MNGRTILINLVSPSGGGKTSIVQQLEELYGYNPIHSYCSRPERYEGEYGHRFIKIIGETDESLRATDRIFHKKDMIAYFNSYDSGYHYFITDELVKRNLVNLYVVDPGGAEQVTKHYQESDVNVFTIYIQVDEMNRVERLARRSSEGDYINPDDLPEIWARIEPDKEIFQTVKCDYVVDGNDEFDKVVELVYDIIQDIKQGVK